MNNFELSTYKRDIGWKNVDINIFKFPAGEMHVRIVDKDFAYSASEVEIKANIHSSDDVMTLLLLTDAVKRKYNCAEIHLAIPYAPYARQDRVAVEGEPLSAAVFAKLINAQGYKTVEVWDSHSDVMLALLDNVVHKEQYKIVKGKLLGKYSRFFKLENTVLVCPDAGAKKKIEKLAKETGIDKIIYADKMRNPVTGEITGTEIVHRTYECDGLDLHLDYLIVDDICDGGGTFIALAKELERDMPKTISLYVTHGIFSKGLTVFEDLVDNVFVANLMNNEVKDYNGKVNLTKI